MICIGAQQKSAVDCQQSATMRRRAIVCIDHLLLIAARRLLTCIAFMGIHSELAAAGTANETEA